MISLSAITENECRAQGELGIIEEIKICIMFAFSSSYAFYNDLIFMYPVSENMWLICFLHLICY